jgi:AcrR family transcriptional regulator
VTARPDPDLDGGPRAEGVRARARRELVRQIADAARDQLAEVGAAALSVRAVTRQLGMAPSAVYRYFPNRDALLTALITDAYVGLADAAADAEAAVPRADLLGRWLAVHRAVRGWALGHRVALLLAGIAVEGWVAGGRPAAGAAGTLPGAALGDALLADARALLGTALEGVEGVDASAVDPRLPLAVVDAWTELFGAVSFELFGHYRRVVEARAEHLDDVARRTAAAVGLPPGS